ncbi:MAG: hypothetical protein ACO3ZZ_06915 [Solirubrobacterales bacterium]
MSSKSARNELRTGSGPVSLALAIVFALGVVGLAVLISTPTDAGAKSERRIVLGKARQNLEPNCGRDFSRDCVVEGKVTAYQVKRSDAARSFPFSVPWTGKIVAWSVSLARPTKREIDESGTLRPAQEPFFNDLFGPPSKAGISVLSRVNRNQDGPPQWRMVRRSPVETLNSYFGSTVHFALDRPLNVIPKQVVALTIPTWAPVLWKPRACNFNSISGVLDPSACARAESNYTWRGSRSQGKCRLGVDPDTGEPNEALDKSRPQTGVDSVRKYGCYYGSNALLYSVTIVGRN